MRLALYQPDIPQNTGALLRLAACLGVALDIIEPCGFPLSDKSLRRTGMDYVDLVDITLHPSWSAFTAATQARQGRVVLLTTTAPKAYCDVRFTPQDVLLLGRESAGVPGEVKQAAALSVRVPLNRRARSLNVAMAAGIVLGEALRQTSGFPTN
jgi:tRNA (cytidine/uridine-2'-O-)-methyltransferase